MPSTVTHAYFTLDVYQKLPISSKEIIASYKPQFKMFGQSMDALFFYNITSLHRGKRIRQFGHYFHYHQSQEFFLTLINYIKYNHYGMEPTVMAFLYGMICHYVLDSTLHPYIIYKSGIYQKENPETVCYQQKHEQLETLIDAYLIQQREHISPWRFPVNQFCFQLTEFDPILKEVIDFSFKETFDVHHMSKFYYKSLQQMYFFYRYIRKDQTGIKKHFYRLVDYVTLRKIYRFEVLSYHQKLMDQKNHLNLDHQTWCHPANKKETSTESFFDLYEQAISKAVKLITEVYAYINEDKKVSLKRLFPNTSYVSGKNCDKELVLQYFEN